MKERRYIKFRVDMFDDTKLKIMDRMPGRDVAQYVWFRLALLAGKVNREGELFLSRNIPYTVETLAIEFNRKVDEVKSALEVLIQLEMMELTEHNVYKVKNFAKHQNIKVKEKDDNRIKEETTRLENIENREIQKEENVQEIIAEAEFKGVTKEEKLKNENQIMREIKVENEINQREAEVANNEAAVSLEINNNSKVEGNITEGKKKNVSQNDISMRKNKGKSKRKREESIIETIDEEPEDTPILVFSEGEITLGEGERIIKQWVFEWGEYSYL